MEGQAVDFDLRRWERILLRQFAEDLPGVLLKLRHALSRFLELLVGDQSLEQLLLRVLLVLLGGLGQQTAALDLQQKRRHGERLAGLVHVEVRRGLHRFDVLLRNFADKNVLQVDLGLADQVQQKMQRPVELL